MDLTNKVVVAVITHDHTRIWTTDMKQGHDPELVDIQQALRHAHVRQAQEHHGHDTSQYDIQYFEELATDLLPAAEILLIGHGKGKGNYMLQFVHHVEEKHPDVFKKIIGTLDENIQALTEQQILEVARHWFSQWYGMPVHYWEAIAH